MTLYFWLQMTLRGNFWVADWKQKQDTILSQIGNIWQCVSINIFVFNNCTCTITFMTKWTHENTGYFAWPSQYTTVSIWVIVPFFIVPLLSNVLLNYNIKIFLGITHHTSSLLSIQNTSKKLIWKCPIIILFPIVPFNSFHPMLI